MEPHRTGRNEPHAPTLEPGRALGSYLILSTLSTSARSTVYMGQDLAIDRPVALKTSPRGAISVIAEGRVLARFNHPHIVTLHGLWAQPPALVLEYLAGETLKARHGRLGALTEPHVRTWMIALLSALEVVHGQGLAHGAIRADNIFLTTDQRIKILDFRQTSLGESPPMPGDDVRATGRLIQELLGGKKGVLADIAQGAILGRYPTARALRLALASAPDAILGETHTSETQDLALAAASLVPVDANPSEEDAGPLFPNHAIPTSIPFLDPLEEPSINPMLPVFHERPARWEQSVVEHKRLGILLSLLLVTVLFAARVGWSYRQTALTPIARVSHAVVRLTHGTPKLAAPVGPIGAAPTDAPSTPTAAPEAVIHPGAYAALAHAWGG